LERLIRYMARPPIATERLERLPDGRVVHEFKRPWRDGTSRAVFEPLRAANGGHGGSVTFRAEVRFARFYPSSPP
jgi:hypothetical protein